MEIQQLRYVVALAREKHFARAARSVNVTQPTLSQQLKKLELELGVALFERSSHGVRLTEAGTRLLVHARAILDVAERALNELHDYSGALTGVIRVGAIPTICPYVMPDVLRAFHRIGPEVRLELFEETTSVLLESIKSGKIDIGVLALPVKERALVSLSLGHEEFLLAVCKSHFLARAKTVDRKRIAKERLLILQEGHCFRAQSLEYCRKANKDMQIVFQGDSLTSVMELAAAGDGVTLVPRMAADEHRNPGIRFVRFNPPRPTRELGIIWRLSAPLTKIQQRFIKVCGDSIL